jgi:hypothetical protein
LRWYIAWGQMIFASLRLRWFLLYGGWLKRIGGALI